MPQFIAAISPFPSRHLFIVMEKRLHGEVNMASRAGLTFTKAATSFSQRLLSAGRQSFCLDCIGKRLLSTSSKDVMNIFDRKTKRHQRNVAARLENHHVYDYLKDEVAHRLVDRLYDISRFFPVALDLGCGKGHLSKHLTKEDVGILHQTDMSQGMLDRCTDQEVSVVSILADEEDLPFEKDFFDIVLSSLSLHWVNDLPGVLKKVLSCLKEDGVFLGAMFGGETLFELRTALQLAEIEQEGGFAPHISPFAQMRDCGNLLTRAGFNLTTVDFDEITVDYPTINHLMQDLKGMGESNASWNRKSYLRRKTIEAASRIYKEYYGNADGSIPATYQILYMIGWKPSTTQAKPLERGSANVSLKDLGSMIKDLPKKPS
ncbi:arginine-hydroxylase NDUFAF5, mitochondrial-like [Rhopilema esculentum]|uniref:arginine-hydroxylase NDUFAF5, mitochondrial-like n=1 Tax=Rhopilema esculentum TaxID=499914 RepID=UPI0031D92A5D